MKQLFILRHAKSSRNDPNLADFDRPLNERGLNAAPFMGEYMTRHGLTYDLILTSPAKRAIDTAIMVKESSGMNAPLKCDERIYEASPRTLMQTVSEIMPGNESVLIVGHNPGIEGFIRLLTGETQPMPTAALADISLDINKWDQIAPGCGKINSIVRPREEMSA